MINEEYLEDEEFFLDSEADVLEAMMEMDEFVFAVGDREMIKLCANGDIYIRGELTENNKDVVVGMMDFLKSLNWDSVEDGLRENNII